MAIHFVCPQCRSNENVADNYAGMTVPCKACGQMVAVPMPQGLTSGQKAAVAGASVGTILMFVFIGLIVLLVGCGGVLVALLLPAVQSARSAARQSMSMNHMKQIMLALHNYHDVNGTFPPAYIADADGKPMTSWRVLILPYVEESMLYDQYDKTKPWNSPENLALAERVPSVYQSPLMEPTPENRLSTNYLLVAGKGTAFANPNGPKMAEITDGTSNTICVVEVADPGIVWTQPSDLDAAQLDFLIHGVRDKQPGQLNATSDRGLNVGMFDGSVRNISPQAPAAEIKKAIESQDGMPSNLQ
jgi:ribosomal protein S27E